MLETLFAIIFLLSPVYLIIGFLKPKKIGNLIKRRVNRKQILISFLAISISSLIGFGIFADPVVNEKTDLKEVQIFEEKPESEEEKIIESELVSEKVKPEIETFLVTKIVDGDTLEIETGKRVRLIGIDTPESGDCYFAEAKDKLSSLVLNKEVILEKDVSETDRYGRLLRYVFFDGNHINEIMVKEGFAHASTYPPDVKYSETFSILETKARISDKGLWGDICEVKPTVVVTTTPTPTAKSIIYSTSTPTKEPVYVPPTTAPVINNSSPYSCNCSKTCSKMSSCAEAYYQLNNCGCSVRDGDNDGVPCESICR